MKSKQSRNLIAVAMSTLTLLNAVVPSYAVNATANIPEILAVGTSSATVGVVSTETELIDDIVIEVLSTAKVRNLDELVSLGGSADLGGAPVYTEANGVTEIVGYIAADTYVVTYAEYEGFLEIIFKEQICYINSKYLEFTIEQNLEDLPQLIEQEVPAVQELDLLSSMNEIEEVVLIEEVAVVEEEVLVSNITKIQELVGLEEVPAVQELVLLEDIAVTQEVVTNEYVAPNISMPTGNSSFNQQEETTTESYADPLDALISMGLFDEDSNNSTATPILAATQTTTPVVTTPVVTTPVATTPSSKYAVVNTSSGLNLRASASTSSTVLAKLPNGTVTDVVEIANGWAKVKVNSTTGYVSLDYVNLTNTKPAVATSTASSSSASSSASTTTSTSSSSSKGTEIVNFAKKYIGTRYVYGGTSLTSGVDCSGFTYSVFKNFGINLNRTSQAQYSNGVAVSKSNLQAGDLVFFNTGGNTSISHVGIYIGNNQYIHSTDGSGNGVCIASLSSAYALRTYYGARRVV